MSDEICDPGRPRLIVDPPAFVAGVALGIVIGVRLVENWPAPPAVLDRADRAPEPEHEAAPTWRERDDTFRPAPSITIPTDAELWRTPQAGLVAVPPEVRSEMQRHVGADPRRERVGLLAGRVGALAGGDSWATVVERAIPLRSSDASETHVVLTADSVVDVGAALRDRAPGSTIVGWFHSHPNLGVFLSCTDLRTQRSCFAADWQVAIVIDPVRGEFGVFGGPNGTPARLATPA